MPVEQIPENINRDSVLHMKSAIGPDFICTPTFEIIVDDSRLTMKQNIHMSSLSKFLAPNAYKTRQTDRCVRPVGVRKSYRLHHLDVVPELSNREYEDLQVDGFLKWETGHMKWDIKKNSDFSKNAKTKGRDVIAGYSGHTEYMHNFMRLFKSYDATITTLIICLWMVRVFLLCFGFLFVMNPYVIPR